MQEKSKRLISYLAEPDRNWAWLIGVSTLVMTLHLYEGNESFYVKHFAGAMQDGPLLDWYKFLYKHLATLLLFFIIPVVVVRKFFQRPVKDFGLTIGDWKFGLVATAIACVIITPMVYISSRNPEFRNFYPLTTLANTSPALFAPWGLTYLPHYVGWEFFPRISWFRNTRESRKLCCDYV